MNESQRAWVVLIGFALGGVLSGLRPQVTVALPGDVGSDCPADPEMASLREQLKTAALRRVEAASEAGLSVRPPPQWPTSLDERFGADRVARQLQEAPGAGDWVGMDCGEYPCIVRLGFSGPDSEDRIQALHTWLIQGPFSSYTAHETRNRGGIVVALALPEAPLSVLDQPRLQIRLADPSLGAP